MMRPRKSMRSQKKKTSESRSVIHKKDLNRIKKSISTTNSIASYCPSSTMTSRSRSSVNESTASSSEIQKRAHERKLKIKRIEEERKKKKVELSDIELEDEKNKESMRKIAIQKKDEDNEVVREMKSMLLKAKCATVRDRQLKEREEKEVKKKEIEEMWHQSMSKDRIQDLDFREQKKSKLHQDTMEGAKMIRVQMAQKREEEMLDKERKCQEGEELLRQLKKADDLERRKEMKKEKAARKVRDEIVRANEHATEAKRLRIQQEKDEDAKIAKYLKEKDARIAEVERQKELAHARREKDSANLRAKQQRAMDGRGELDEIRARRAQEKKERAWRKQQLDKAQKKKEMDEELAVARVMQLKYKETHIAEAIEEEKREYARMMKNLKQSQEETMKNHQLEQTFKQTYHHELIQQMSDNTEKRRLQKLEDKGGNITENKEERRTKLECIKQRTLEEMKAIGIPREYQIELERYQIRC